MNSNLNNRVAYNFFNVKLYLLIPSFILLFLLFSFINYKGGEFTITYVNIQKDLFFYLNHSLSKFPNLQFNLTQLGDVLVFFPLVAFFIVNTPKLWEALLTSSIISLLVSFILKKLFAVPRPAAMFDNDSFVIIGKTLSGQTSFPSGHSIATFIVITTLLFAFMPKKSMHKIIWSSCIILLGLIISFSRVGVGAHYPLDVLFGSAIGYIVAILGIKFNNKMNWLSCIKNKKYYPVFILILIIWAVLITKKILENNLLIFYVSLVSLVITLSLIIRLSYVKKN